MTTPARPESVPAHATFNDGAEQWELGDRDDAGRLHGAFTAFRADGTLLARATYLHGELDGVLSRFSDGSLGSQALRSCCVPPGAREIRARYRAGRLLDETFYDDRGRPICDDGTPWPERRGDVPADARYDETSSRFIARSERDDGTTTLRYYDLDGVRVDEIDARGGQAREHRRFFPDGTLAERTGLDDDGRRQGEFFARFSPHAGRYADARIVEVHGEHAHAEPIGRWEFLDQAGELVKRVEFGAVLDASSLPVVAGREPDGVIDAEALWRLAEAPARPPRESAALGARALAKSGDRERYARFMAARSAALAPESAAARAEEVATAKNVTQSALLGAVLAGSAPAVLFRTLASSLEGHAPAALDYFDASVLFAPEQALVGMGRALLCIEHGDPDGALVAARLAERESAQAADSLRQFERVTYGAYPFRPAVDGVAPPDEELVEVDLQQPFEAILSVIELYATRLLLVRRELARRVRGTPPWLPPDTTVLLPNGPRELQRRTARIEDEGENGPEITEVTIDESVSFERSTRRLLATARADWAALGWLCWACGLDAIARPERVVARPEFAAAAHQATVRCWRSHDRMRMSGLVALARQIEGFEWEGMSIDAVPPHLIEVAAAEYLEVRAVFFWLMFPQNESPFQSDLRRA
ncbi:MAG TPA: hypothetical protein VMI54_07700 [Polyangiaceae bacterium]|nr:hypothetical protein [Polyangiaceae bacterium]